MIRKYEAGDTDALVAVWESASSVAHPFLTDEFMAREAACLRTQHLPNAETWVLENEGSPVGFIALIGDEIGGLFLEPSHHGRGLGKALVDHAASIRKNLHVEVFARNVVGRRFYDRYGFVEAARYRHEESGEMILRLTRPSR